MVRILVLIGLGCVALSGCATLKDGRYEMAQSCNAQWAWYRAKPPCKDKAYPRHFRSGWKEGYKNVALGGGGLVPPVPPQKYWSARYETCEGRQMISSWYGGYQIGAIEAEKRGEDNCHPVPTACMVALPENGCPCNESTAMSQAPYNSHVSSQAPHAEFLEPSPVAETTTIPVVSEPMLPVRPKESSRLNLFNQKQLLKKHRLFKKYRLPLMSCLILKRNKPNQCLSRRRLPTSLISRKLISRKLLISRK